MRTVDLAVQTPDLREVSAADIAQYATEKDISTAHLFETSAKDNIGIMEVSSHIHIHSFIHCQNLFIYLFSKT